jgi:hypothetical protein
MLHQHSATLLFFLVYLRVVCKVQGCIALNVLSILNKGIIRMWLDYFMVYLKILFKYFPRDWGKLLTLCQDSSE